MSGGPARGGSVGSIATGGALPTGGSVADVVDGVGGFVSMLTGPSTGGSVDEVVAAVGVLGGMPAGPAMGGSVGSIATGEIGRAHV